ncbi:helicase [Halolactibacillus alkaliphilus]|uniref:Helicase n=2 Tax=Halolactibacillus alkaliphilus TaxID=442899 RepID=A0A511X2I9_9BACI|nr:helicase [Halolactibacillus alkaliphilus]GGN72106.1 helicase [Halolactibacillus alkaliphilus]SFO88008.1 PLD-like domain-containing protein [Halolactibacillus alkaliphilus]
MFQELLKLTNLEVRIAEREGFHSKGYIFDHGDYHSLIVGSSNLTATALKVNYEWNIKLTSHQHGAIIGHFTSQFDDMWHESMPLSEEWIVAYRQKHQRYSIQSVADFPASYQNKWSEALEVKPNKMQQHALLGIADVRNKGEKRALVVSATGTGKTFLAAFDVRRVRPKRLLFIVHREQILKKAMTDFRRVIGGNDRDYGILSGTSKDLEAKYLFATVQSVSRPQTLQGFNKDSFDYLLIDETHRAGATSYQKIIDHFDPLFMLGMTATPERTDGYDLFKLFHYNIAYEIRLKEALAEDLLVPFHYFGVSDYEVNGQVREDMTFKDLSIHERVRHIREKLDYYSFSGERPHGLIFCATKLEAMTLSKALNISGLKTVSLTGDDPQSEREKCVKQLENGQLDYILTVDIFNEGIDIPKINQVVMLRQTESSIIFVQQLGRGLRKHESKEFLTVIDFIGNHENNYLIPVALYGDQSYNKDQLRRQLVERSRAIPGESTINFEKIAEERIFNAIDQKNMLLKKDLDQDFLHLKYKVGKIPSMMDFVEHGSRDPMSYVAYSKSYYRYVSKLEKGLPSLSEKADKSLVYLGQHVLNGIRGHEGLLCRLLIENEEVAEADLLVHLNQDVYASFNEELRRSVLRSINLLFYQENYQKKRRSPQEFLQVDFIDYHDASKTYKRSACFSDLLKEDTFKQYLADHAAYATHLYEVRSQSGEAHEGFVIYQKYTRQDVFRLLLWDENPLAQNVGGYIISQDKSNCAIFINYHKEETISDTTKYEDQFITPQLFQWVSKSKRTLQSPDVLAIRNYQSHGMRLPLFIKKHNDEGTSFYYMGDVEPVVESFKEDIMATGEKTVSVVKMMLRLKKPVEKGLYNYLTDQAGQRLNTR